MKHFYNEIQGFFNFSGLYSEMVKKHLNGSHFVEIGCWKGKSAIYMGVEIINSNKNIKFDCIDNWEYEQRDKKTGNIIFNGNMTYSEFLKNIKPISNKINHYRLKSVEASKLYDDESLDFVYIDASHKYVDVKNDLINWYPKIKKGGIIAGHDYNDYFYGVKSAINEFFFDKKFDVDLKSWSWIHKK